MFFKDFIFNIFYEIVLYYDVSICYILSIYIFLDLYKISWD